MPATAYYWLRNGRVAGVYTVGWTAAAWAARRGGVVRTVETADECEKAVIEKYHAEQERLFAE